MKNVNNPRHRLDSEQIDEARRQYEDIGWKIKWIATFFGVHHSSIIFHIKLGGWVRKVKVTRAKMPAIVARAYRKKKRARYLKKLTGSYEYIKHFSEENKRQCSHTRWVKRCSLCGEILGSDALCPQDHPLTESNAHKKIIVAL